MINHVAVWKGVCTSNSSIFYY